MKIGVELNNIIRDLNFQAIKYFKKDIMKTFDDENVDMNVTNIIDSLPFESKIARNNFTYIDYPYELFGCAKTMHRNQPTLINEWLENLNDNGHDVNMTYFSLRENALTIQSTYYFLSKTACRIREMHFPEDGKDMWKICDVLITTDKRVVEKRPKNKVVILIRKNDNTKLESKADFVYDSLLDLMNDETLIENIEKKLQERGMNFFKKIANKFVKKDK